MFTTFTNTFSRISRLIDAVYCGGKIPDDINDQQLIEDAISVITQLRAENSTLKHTHLKSEQLIYIDGLTNVFNRRKFDEDWKELINSKRNTFITCMVIDCNDFSSINNTHGHLEGDRVLRLIASTLQHTLRDGDKLYRFGGDEFIILLKGVTLNNAVSTAHRCIEAMTRADFNLQEPVQVSIGIAQANTQDDTIHLCLQQADKAMYEAKHSTDHVCVHKNT